MASSLSKGKKRGPKPKTAAPQAPIPAESSPSVDSGPASDDLSRIVEESKERLAAEEPQAPKNKGGRPKGSTNKPKEEPVGQAASPIDPEPSEMTKGVVAMPFFIAAENTGCPLILLSDAETRELAQVTELAMKTYLPQLSEKAGVLAVCVGSFAMVSFSKFMIYKQWKIKNQPIATSDDGKTEVHASETPKEPVSPTAKADTRPPILAESFFPRENQ